MIQNTVISGGENPKLVEVAITKDDYLDNVIKSIVGTLEPNTVYNLSLVEYGTLTNRVLFTGTLSVNASGSPVSQAGARYNSSGSAKITSIVSDTYKVIVQKGNVYAIDKISF